MAKVVLYNGRDSIWESSSSDVRDLLADIAQLVKREFDEWQDGYEERTLSIYILPADYRRTPGFVLHEQDLATLGEAASQ